MLLHRLAHEVISGGMALDDKVLWKGFFKNKIDTIGCANLEIGVLVFPNSTWYQSK